jgi:hypothetical protein
MKAAVWGQGSAAVWDKSAIIGLTATCEYLFAECAELAGNAARDNRETVVADFDMWFACHNDEELNVLMGGGGRPPMKRKE